MSVQFSGGEPTLSPYFLDAVRYARKSDTTPCKPRPMESNSQRVLNSVNRQSKPACAMRICNSTDRQRRQRPPHGRQLVRREIKAIENLHKAGVEIVPVVTIVTASTMNKSDASSSSRSTIPKPLAS